MNETQNNYSNNTATNFGGAILNDNTGTITETRNTFINNSASYGGAVFNNGGNSTINYCRIISNTGIDIYNYSGAVNATDNWWGSNFTGTNPTNMGRATSNVNTSTWIVLTLTANPTSIPVNGNSTITADLLHDNTGATVTGTIPYTGIVTFTTTLGTITNANMSNGTAITTLNAGNNSGTATITATIDNTTVTTQVNI